LLLGNGPRTRRCKAIGIDKEQEEDYQETRNGSLWRDELIFNKTIATLSLRVIDYFETC
jgi:hypothetical protein